MIFQKIVIYQCKSETFLKKSSNRGAILIRRNLDCQNEFKVDLDLIGLLKSTNIGYGMNSVDPTVNNFRGSYCDNIPFGYGLSISQYS